MKLVEIKSFSIQDVLYHVAIFAVSAAIALSIHHIHKLIELVEENPLCLSLAEISIAITLIVLFNLLGMGWRYHKMATNAGLDFVAVEKKKGLRDYMEKLGSAGTVKVLGETGFGTFADADGKLHKVLLQCHEAKIMLLNPFSGGASACVNSSPDPDMTLEVFRERIFKSIFFLKNLKAHQKNIKLKLYNDLPLFQLVVLGDHIFFKQYTSAPDTGAMPEYVFKHSTVQGNLYDFFHKVFFRGGATQIPRNTTSTPTN